MRHEKSSIIPFATRILAFTLACLMVLTGLPESLYTWLSGSSTGRNAAIAEGAEVSTGEKDGWQYAITESDTLTLYGYTDPEATELVLPERLGEMWVTGIGSGAFAENTALRKVTVPGSIHRIDKNAFSAQASLTIVGRNGTRAMAFAAERGCSFINVSPYDFYDDILDMTDWAEGSWRFIGSQLQVDMPYAAQITVGKRLFVPPCTRYSKGMPLQVTSIQASGSGLLLNCSEVSFEDSIEHLVVENEACLVDVNGITTAEGVTLTGVDAGPRSRSTSTTEVKVAALTFDYKFPMGVGTEISGSVKLTPSATLSFDFGWFKLNSIELSMKEKFEVEAKASYGLKGQDGTVNLYHDDNKKNAALDRRLARIPLYSAGLVSLNLDVNLVVNCYGEVTLKITYEKNTKITWKNGDEHPVTTVTKKFSDPSISAAFTVSIQVKGSLKITIGFGDLSIDVLELSAAIGPKVTATTCNGGALEPLCIDVYIRLVITLEARVGLLDKKENNGGIFSAKLEFGIKKEWEFDWWHKHFWLSDFSFHDDCGKGQSESSLLKTYSLTFHAGNGYPPETQTIMEGMKAEKPWNPKREGYTFAGWYIQGTDTPFDFDTLIDRDYTIVARWTNNDTGEEETAPVVTLAPTPTPTPAPTDHPDPTPSGLTPEEEASVGYFITEPYEETVYGEYAYDDTTYYYTRIVGITGSPTDLHIPAQLDGKRVALSSGAFAGCSSLTSLHIDNVYMQNTAFSDCKNLKTVVFNSRLTNTGRGITAYGSCSFEGCTALTSVTLPTVQTDNSHHYYTLPPFPCFKGCTALQRIVIPEVYTGIPANAFEDCTALTAVTVQGEKLSVGKCAFRNCTALALPPFDHFSFLGESAFENCTALENVQISPAEGGAGTGKTTFRGCSNLETVTIRAMKAASSNQLPYINIGEEAFTDCPALTEVSLIASAYVSLGKKAFVGCENLPEIRIFSPDIRAYRFLETGSEVPVIIPNTCTIAANEDSAFEGVRFSGNSEMTVSSVKNRAFLDATGLHQVTVAVKTAGSTSYVFQNSDVQSVTIQAAYYGSTTGFFSNCTQLQSATFTGTAANATLGKSMFIGCTALQDVTLPSGVKEISSSLFSGCKSLPAVQLPTSVTTIKDYAFSGCSNLTALQLPASVTTISYGAFNNCVSLQSMVLPYGITKIDNNTFAGCTALQNISLPVTVTSIGNYAFRDCASLRNITIPDKITSLGISAFSGCENLQSLIIEAPLTDIPNSCFSNCASLTSLTLPEGMETITDWAFSGCTSLRDVSFPRSLRTISYSAFSGCESLTSVTIPAEDVIIQNYAFSGCTALREVHLYAGAQLGSSVFSRCGQLETLAMQSAFLPLEDQTYASVFKGAGSLLFIYLPTSQEQGDLAEYIRSTWPRAVFLPYESYGTELLRAIFDDGHGGIQTSLTAVGALLCPPEEPTVDNYTLEGWELYSPGGDDEIWDFATRRVTGNDVFMQLGDYRNCVFLNAVWRYNPYGFTWAEKDGGAIITRYTGKLDSLTLPDTLDGLPVTGIAAGAIGSGVKEITFNADLRTIEDGAFMYASDLIWINAEACDAFLVENCLLYSADGTRLKYCCQDEFYPALREETESIAPYAFYSSDCQEISLPEGVTEIGESAFAFSRQLRQLNIAGTVQLGKNATLGCTALEEVFFAVDADFIDENNFQEHNTFVYGPMAAPVLTAYADQYDVKYNQYPLSFWQEEELLATFYVQAGQPVPQPALPEEMEKALLGWHDQSSDGTELWNFATGTMPAEELNLTAVWGYTWLWETVENGVRLTAYTGISETPRIPATIDGEPVVSISADCFGTLTIMGIQGEKGSPAESFAAEKGLPFTAVTHTVTFESGVGSLVPARTVTADVLLEEPAVSATGYQLEGWYQVLNGALNDSAWDFALNKTPQDDMTLRAIWTQIADATQNLYDLEQVTDGVSIRGYNGTSHRISIPASINGQAVVAISPYAFWNSEQLYSVTLPASIRSIGEGAFADSRLSRVVIRDGCESIGDSAFAGCGELSSVSLPDSITSIGSYAFADCVSLPSITLPAGLTALSEGCLSGCLLLDRLTIPNQVVSIGSGALAGCAWLTHITLGEALQTWAGDAANGCVRLSSLSVQAGNTAFTVLDQVLYSADRTSLVLYPADLTAEQFTVPEGVTHIQNGAMAGSRLSAITLPASLTVIGSEAFRDAKRLQTIIMPEGSVVNAIGEKAFAGCQKLTSFTVPEGVALLRAGTFDSCFSLRELVIPGSTTVEKGAFPVLSTLTVYGVAGSSAQAQAEEIGVRFVNLADADSALAAIALSDETLELIPGETRTLEPTLIPASTTETALTWYSGNPAIATVTDGAVKARYTGVTTIWVEGAGGIQASCQVHVVNFRETDYTLRFDPERVTLAQPGERLFLTLTITPTTSVMPALTWSVADPAILSCANGLITGLKKGITTVSATLPGGQKAVCTVVVRDPSQIFRLLLPDELTVVEEEAFAGIGMEEVVCPASLRRIESRAFAECEQLTRIVIPAGVSYIAPDAFEGSGQVTITGPAGSEAARYAEAMHIPFTPQ